MNIGDKMDAFLDGDPNENTETAPEWMRNPASIQPIQSISEFKTKANSYFSECIDMGMRSTITGFCLAVGLPGPTSLIRLGQRIPDLRYTISCCMTVISHEYEQMIGSGNAAGPLFMLKNIPDFDPEEPVGSPGVQFFNDRKEVLLTTEVYGAVTSGEDFDAGTDPLDVYLSIISKKAASIKNNKRNSMSEGMFKDSEPPSPTKLLRIINEV